jgi:nucleoside-diphosphate-sugar epimerase
MVIFLMLAFAFEILTSKVGIAAMNFTPTEIAAEIKKHIPDLDVTYALDFRQKIADSWPDSLDDSRAREDWGWKYHLDLESMTVDILKNLALQYDTDFNNTLNPIQKTTKRSSSKNLETRPF